MDILHRVIRKIHADPGHPTSSTLRALIKSLDAGDQFDVNQLYQLNYSDFTLAMDLLKQWRLDSFRYERGLGLTRSVRSGRWRAGAGVVGVDGGEPQRVRLGARRQRGERFQDDVELPV